MNNRTFVITTYDHSTASFLDNIIEQDNFVSEEISIPNDSVCFKENSVLANIASYNVNTNITNASILRMCKKAGISSISAESYPFIKNIIHQHIYNTIKKILAIRETKKTKKLTDKDVKDFFDCDS